MGKRDIKSPVKTGSVSPEEVAAAVKAVKDLRALGVKYPGRGAQSSMLGGYGPNPVLAFSNMTGKD